MQLRSPRSIATVCPTSQSFPRITIIFTRFPVVCLVITPFPVRSTDPYQKSYACLLSLFESYWMDHLRFAWIVFCQFSTLNRIFLSLILFSLLFRNSSNQLTSNQAITFMVYPQPSDCKLLRSPFQRLYLRCFPPNLRSGLKKSCIL